MQYQPFSPVDIRFGTLQILDNLFSSLTDKRTIIVASNGTIERLAECTGIVSFANSDNNCLISDIQPNPSVADVCRYLNMLRHKGNYQSILAIGGGSSIDIAKAISALRGIANTKDVCYEDVVQAVTHKLFFKECEPADIVAVTTTAGTGSEVTKWATVWDFKNKKKLSVEHALCYPKYAYIIPALTKSMPKRITLATGLDALSHAMEGYWSKGRNPLSQALSLDSIGRIKEALPAVLKNLEDDDARGQMCLASLLAGLSFSITKTTACHSISYPLTMDYNVEHGFAAALTLSSMIDVNAKAVPELVNIIELFESAGGFDVWMADVTQGIQELKLSAFGIEKDNIDSIAEGAFTLGRMDNNPVPLELQSVKAILNNIL